jgi:hypothetical protein
MDLFLIGLIASIIFYPRATLTGTSEATIGTKNPTILAIISESNVASR